MSDGEKKRQGGEAAIGADFDDNRPWNDGVIHNIMYNEMGVSPAIPYEGEPPRKLPILNPENPVFRTNKDLPITYTNSKTGIQFSEPIGTRLYRNTGSLSPELSPTDEMVDMPIWNTEEQYKKNIKKYREKFNLNENNMPKPPPGSRGIFGVKDERDPYDPKYRYPSPFIDDIKLDYILNTHVSDNDYGRDMYEASANAAWRYDGDPYGLIREHFYNNYVKQGKVTLTGDYDKDTWREYLPTADEIYMVREYYNSQFDAPTQATNRVAQHYPTAYMAEHKGNSNRIGATYIEALEKKAKEEYEAWEQEKKDRAWRRAQAAGAANTMREGAHDRMYQRQPIEYRREDWIDEAPLIIKPPKKNRDTLNKLFGQ
jgi:hypothetical protein